MRHRPRHIVFAGLMLVTASVPALAQLRLYEHNNFGGRSVEIRDSEEDLRGLGFNDAASSARLSSGCSAILYSDIHFRGKSWT
ncbi:MAG TPA: beta/gamma crystallin-related protein, partial [Thermoanaerobaculia bacterium]